MSEVATDSPYLPRFSKPSDIDDFVEKLAAFERGDIGPEQFRAFRLTRGVYGQRQEDNQMLRVKIPFGLVGKAQLDALADVGDAYAHGIGHVTTRQNVQFHFLKMSDAEPAMRRLDQAGLTTRDACGNSVRTVTASEEAEICPTSPFDVSPYAEALTRYFLGHPLSGVLPRKFKIAMSCCAADSAMAAINDLGFVAVEQDGQRGFKVLAAGGLSTSPQAALVLHDFIPAADIFRVGESILRLFHALGNRENKHRARLKYVLRKLGEPEFRAAYARVRAEVDREGVRDLALAESPARTPAPPVAAPQERAPSYLAWRAGATQAQKQPGYHAVSIRLFLGELSTARMRALGDITARYGDGSLRITLDQNLLLAWVDTASLPALHQELAALGLAETGRHSARDVVSCPGASSCNLAVTSSRSLARAISERLAADDAKHLAGVEGTHIKISGCPNSCGQHHVADLGFHGGARTNDGVTIPVYQLHLGGGVDHRGARFGKQVVKIPARRVPDAVVTLLALYEAERTEGETPTAFFQRVAPKEVTKALSHLLAPAEEKDRTDIGETQGFLVDTREGECAA